MSHNPVGDHPVQSALVGQLFTTFEVSRLFKVSQRTVQIWIRSGELPAVRYGRIGVAGVIAGKFTVSKLDEHFKLEIRL